MLSIYIDPMIAAASPPLCRCRAFQLGKNEAVRDDSGARPSWIEVQAPRDGAQ